MIIYRQLVKVQSTNYNHYYHTIADKLIKIRRAQTSDFRHKFFKQLHCVLKVLSSKIDCSVSSLQHLLIKYYLYYQILSKTSIENAKKNIRWATELNSVFIGQNSALLTEGSFHLNWVLWLMECRIKLLFFFTCRETAVLYTKSLCPKVTQWDNVSGRLDSHTPFFIYHIPHTRPQKKSTWWAALCFFVGTHHANS
jgi:hypothetical protein